MRSKTKKIICSVFVLFIFVGCEMGAPQKESLNNYEKHLADKYDAQSVTVNFQIKENKTTNEAWPDSFKSAVVTITDSDYLTNSIENERFFNAEYDTIQTYLQNSAGLNNLRLELTIVDSLENVADTNQYLTRSRSKTPYLVTGN